MHPPALRLAAAVLCLSVSVTARAATPHDSLIDRFVRQAAISDIVISPGGDHLAVVRREDGREFLSIMDRKTLDHRALIGFGDDEGIARVVWASDDRVLIWPSRQFWRLDGKLPTGEIYGMDASGRNRKALFGAQAVGSRSNARAATLGAIGRWAQLVDPLINDTRHVLLQTHEFSDRGERTRLVRLNVRSGAQHTLALSPNFSGTFVRGPRGRVELSVGTTPDLNFEVHYRLDGEGTFQRVSASPQHAGAIEPFAPVPLPALADATHSHYLAYSTVDRSTRALVHWSPSTGKKELLHAQEDADIHRTFVDHEGNVYAVETHRHVPAYHYLQPPDHPLVSIHQRLRRVYPGHDVSLGSVSRDGRYGVALVASDRNPGTYLLFDTDSGRIQQLGERMPWLRAEDLARMEPVELRVRDGLAVPAYLSIPVHGTRPFPLVVRIHGGPHFVRDMWGFQADVQMLAAAGYAVLQVNYRGSGGFGRHFEEKGFGEWGGAMQRDVTDATRWAIADGVADPARICIFGGSYGAYAALTGAFQDPDLYQCAIGYAGVYDLPLMFRSGDIPRRWLGRNYLRSTLPSDETLKARSPVFHADRITARVLLAHGALDARAPIDHAHRMRAALERAGNAPVWVRESGEVHGFVDPDNRRRLYSEMLSFLDSAIGEQP